MNFVKANGNKDELKKLEACIVWFFITFVLGFLARYYIAPEFKDIEPDTKSAAVFGCVLYILILILTCSIKSIKAGSFEAASSKTDGNPDKSYKIFAYGIGPYVADRLKIMHLDDIYFQEAYHLCEIKTYETIANRQFWNIFCPFIETEKLTEKEIDDIFIYSCSLLNIRSNTQLNIQLNK